MIYIAVISLCAIILPSLSERKIVQIAIGVLCPLAICTSSAFFYINYSGMYTYSVQYVIPISFMINKTYMIFACFISILWMFANLYSIAYISYNYEKSKIKIFMPFYNMAVCTSIFIVFSENLITTFVFYEILTLSTLPLVGFNRNKTSLHSIKKYAFILLFAAVTLFLPATLLFYNVIGTTSFTQDSGTISLMFAEELSDITSPLEQNHYIPSYKMMMIILVMLVFGVAKNALFPLNAWLPASMCAPAPVSALLHSVAVVKSGAFIIYKIVYELYGIKYMETLYSMYKPCFVIIMCIATIGIVYSSIKALFSTDFKQVLAYSTISNMTYIFMLFWIANEHSMILGLIYIIIHGFTKIGLFFISGLMYSIYKTNNYRRMPGALNNNKMLLFSMLVFAFSIAGFPITSGFIGKHHIIETMLESQRYIALCGIVFSSITTVIYLGKPLLYMVAPSKSHILDRDIKNTIKFVIFPLALINIVGFFVLMNVFAT